MLDVGAGEDLDRRIVDDLATAGWACAPAFLPQALWTQLAKEAGAAAAAGQLRPAAVGGGSQRRLAEQTRSDDMLWLDIHHATPAQAAALDRLDRLRIACNRELQLGLFEFEGHFAHYANGRFYRRHRDQLAASDARVLSCVVYLNSDWREHDGGQLRLYLDADGGPRYVDVPPVGGTLVCFLSARFWHEVLEAQRERLSLTGWFRRRT